MAKELLKRSEVDEKLTWDISHIYATEEEMDADILKMKEICEKIEAMKGTLTTAEKINEAVDLYREFVRLYNLASNYCELATSVDYYNHENQEREAKFMRTGSLLLARLSFVDLEIASQSEEVIEKAIKETKDNKFFLQDVLANKPHMLSIDGERVLAAFDSSLKAPYQIYNVCKLADMNFDHFTADGKEYPLGYSLFEDDYEYEPNTAVRRGAFEHFSKKIREYENVTAQAYDTQVQKEKIESSLRGYDSVFDFLLFDQKVDRTMYERQIDLIMEKLAPHMRKYASLIKKVHKLDKMTYADLKLTIDPEFVPGVTIEQSKEYIEKGLSIMGEEYGKMIKEAYANRWVDFVQNKGKSTGGFCASPYGKHSYILLSWNDRMSDVFTLAHELGHAGHFKMCNEAQSIFDTEVSTYFVEAPSTTNELLMAHYLLSTSDDKRFRRWVLSSMISNTYYHNFVTHLLEAAYQREVYKIVDAGGSVSAPVLDDIMKKTLEKFWGDAVELTEGAELTWMRQPHYYMGLYSYTYSAGLTIGTQVMKRIEKEGEVAVSDWKKALTAGSTKTPLELAKMAGVDISTDAPLLDTIAYIGEIIDEICRLTEELE